MPAPGYGSRRTFTQRAGLFCFGIAIGLSFLGFVQWRKQQSQANPPPADQAPAETAPASPGEAPPEPTSEEPAQTGAGSSPGEGDGPG